MKRTLKDKVVLVTGAAAGIGRAIAQAAARDGANLVLGDLDEAGLAETGALLAAEGLPFVARPCDVRQQAELDALVAAGAARFGPVDVVFANAGILGKPAQVWAQDEETFARHIDVNLMGVWRTLKASLPGMIERRAGVVVVTSSVAGLVGAPGLAAYVASKHALLGLVKSTALEVAPLGIRINALCPHMVDTPMLDRLFGDDLALRDSLRAMNPMRRAASCEEVAESALFLGSGRSGYVTGTHLAVDGGHIAQ